MMVADTSGAGAGSGSKLLDVWCGADMSAYDSHEKSRHQSHDSQDKSGQQSKDGQSQLVSMLHSTLGSDEHMSL